MQIVTTTKGGMIHYISQLSNALSKSNEVIIIAPLGIEAELLDRSIKLNQLHIGDNIPNFIKNTIFLTRMKIFLKTIKEINPDIIHIQDCHPWMCLFLPFLQNYTIVTTVHDVKTHLGSRKIDKEIARNVHVRYSDALIVHGKNAKIILENKAGNKNIFIIPHGDYSFFTKFALENYAEEPGNILFFGRIVEYKGLQYLIEAMTKIGKIVPDAKLVIAGSGSLDSFNINSYNFEIYNYYIPESEVGRFFQRASVVVLPYIEGTQTGIIPIAYAFKKPVIVTNVGSIPEVVENGKTGFIVPARDSNALAEATIRLLQDDILRKEMGENAYVKMKKELSWDIIAEKTIEVYKNVINKKNKYSA